MKIQTKELIGEPLDWAVHRAYCEGACDDEPLTDDERYSTNWAQGGKLYARSEIFPSKTAAILEGHARLRKQQADLDKKQTNINKRRAALEKAA